MQEMGYLEYEFRRNGGQEAQEEERVKKIRGTGAGVGKGRFEGNWERKMKLFDLW